VARNVIHALIVVVAGFAALRAAFLAYAASKWENHGTQVLNTAFTIINNTVAR